jgi:dolichyl-phosphate beta-glucosyltransferase
LTADIGIVVPCFNEEKRLPVEQFQRFLRTETGTQLIFVDDGSTDGTAVLIDTMRQGFEPAVRLLRKSPNAGKAEAVRSGMLHALEGGFKYVGFFDADLATPLDAVAHLRGILDANREIAMVFGARVKLLGRSIERLAVRHYTGRVFATFVSIALRIPVYDTQCGAKLFRATPELGKLLQEPFLARWIFDVELIARFIVSRRASGMTPAEKAIFEFPLHVWNDVSGSKLRLTDYLLAVRDLWRIYRRYLR